MRYSAKDQLSATPIQRPRGMKGLVEQQPPKCERTGVHVRVGIFLRLLSVNHYAGKVHIQTASTTSHCSTG